MSTPLMGPGPVLETPRMILRPPGLEDFPRWAESMAHESARFIGGPLETPAAAWRPFMTMVGAWALTGIGMFSLIEKDTGLWMGRIGPWQPLDWPGNEVGWGVHPEAAGRGLALEAAEASMDYAFDVLGWADVIHCIAPDNIPSQRLAMKLGSRNQGPTRLPPPYHEAAVDRWGQSRADWAVNRLKPPAERG
ncbi:MAG: GNAT family N-acetyltransferase [Brevundimonas sp.]|uniref:GNAT family N-acetyltransferase n=1 Tax=Brevundimonas sp. TaxID=1871086 RepID=UPI00391CF65B